MPFLPTFCDTCGAIFPSDVFFGNVINANPSDNLSGPCPKCGAMGHIPEGTYNIINKTIELLNDPGKSVDELNKLATILRNSQVKGLGIDEIRQQVHQEVPELTSILELLPKTHPHVYQIINIILFIVTIIISLTLAGHQPAITTQDIINNFYYQPAP